MFKSYIRYDHECYYLLEELCPALANYKAFFNLGSTHAPFACYCMHSDVGTAKLLDTIAR